MHLKEMRLKKRREDRDLSAAIIRRKCYSERKATLKLRTKELQKQRRLRQDFIERAMKERGMIPQEAPQPPSELLLEEIKQRAAGRLEERDALRKKLHEAKQNWQKRYHSMRPHRNREIETELREKECERQRSNHYHATSAGRYVKRMMHRDDPYEGGICQSPAQEKPGLSLRNDNRNNKPFYGNKSTRTYGRDGHPYGYERRHLSNLKTTTSPISKKSVLSSPATGDHGE